MVALKSFIHRLNNSSEVLTSLRQGSTGILDLLVHTLKQVNKVSTFFALTITPIAFDVHSTSSGSSFDCSPLP